MCPRAGESTHGGRERVPTEPMGPLGLRLQVIVSHSDVRAVTYNQPLSHLCSLYRAFGFLRQGLIAQASLTLVGVPLSQKKLAHLATGTRGTCKDLA